MANEAPKIGLDKVYIAKVLSDDENGITYDTPIALPGGVNASVNPNSDVATDYADNGVFFVTNNRGNTELTLEMIDIDADTLALMLGQTKTNGITVEKPLDQSPYFAVMFRVWIAGTDANGNNRYQYFCYAKGKFSVPETGGTTKKESIEFGHINLTAQFAQTVANGVICTHARSDDPDVSSSVIANWFNAPVVTVAQNNNKVTVAATVSSGKIVLTGTKGTGDAFTFAESSARLGETIIVTDALGAPVAGTLTFGGTTTAPTITFTPAAEAEAFAAVTVTSGLKDNYGVGVTPMTDTSLS